jgi:hypothetical protein
MSLAVIEMKHEALGARSFSSEILRTLSIGRAENANKT